MTGLSSRAEEKLLGAKMVGRWPSGAPLALAPTHDDPKLGRDAGRHNDFGYADDPRGLKCPVGAHARRANPRDAFDDDGSVNVQLHRMIRRGTSYGPALPEDVLEDDGQDRGVVFVFAGAHLKRQFEFVKTQWLNDGIFIGAPAEKDPLVGPRRHRELHHPATPDPPTPTRLAAVRRDTWRRVLLRPRAAGDELVGGSDDMTDLDRTEGTTMAGGSTRTDRWDALDFAPPAADLVETEPPVLLDYRSGDRVAIITLNRPHADNAITTEMGAPPPRW